MQFIEEIDITLIDPNPEQPRDKKLRDIDGLAAAIKAAGGIIEPVVLVAAGDRYVTVAGHRRIAAVRKLRRRTVPAIVHKDLTVAQQLIMLMAENGARDDFDPVEEARGIQRALALGVPREQLSASVMRKEAELEFAKTITDKATPKLIEDVTASQANLLESAALAEFAGEKDDYERLLANVGSHQFTNVLKRIREDRAREAKVASTTDKLKRAGVRILRDYQQAYEGREVTSLPKVDGKPVSSTAHSTCPGHAALVTYDGTAKFYCTQPELHGLTPLAQRAAARQAEAAEENAAKRRNRKAWKAATAARHEHIKAWLSAGGAYPIAAFETFIYHAVREFGIASAPQRLSAGISYGPTKAAFELGSIDAPTFKSVFVLAAGAAEFWIAGQLKGNGLVDPDRVDKYDRGALKAYYDALRAIGYAPESCELTLIGESTLMRALDKVLAPEPEVEDDVREVD